MTNNTNNSTVTTLTDARTKAREALEELQKTVKSPEGFTDIPYVMFHGLNYCSSEWLPTLIISYCELIRSGVELTSNLTSLSYKGDEEYSIFFSNACFYVKSLSRIRSHPYDDKIVLLHYLYACKSLADCVQSKDVLDSLYENVKVFSEAVLGTAITKEFIIDYIKEYKLEIKRRLEKRLEELSTQADKIDRLDSIDLNIAD